MARRLAWLAFCLATSGIGTTGYDYQKMVCMSTTLVPRIFLGKGKGVQESARAMYVFQMQDGTENIENLLALVGNIPSADNGSQELRAVLHCVTARSLSAEVTNT